MIGHCPTCDRIAYTSFNWENAHTGTHKDTATIAANLEPRGPLKFGHLFQCRRCNLYWYLDDDGESMHRVPVERTALLLSWSKSDLTPTVEAITQFQRIGATGADQYGNGKGEVKVPCAIATTSGDTCERAVALITKMPPVADWQKWVLLGNAVAAIRESDDALPMAVRRAALRADEISMGFAPTGVQAIDGRYFVLNWSPSFFSYGPLRGKDISLSKERFRIESDIPIVHEQADLITYVYFDWYPGIESLLQSVP